MPKRKVTKQVTGKQTTSRSVPSRPKLKNDESYQEYARASLFAKLYLAEQRGEDAWRNVPVLLNGDDDVTIGDLDLHPQFGVIVPRLWSQGKESPPKSRPFKWFKLAGLEKINWVRDVLLSRREHAICVKATDDWLYYEFSDNPESLSKSESLANIIWHGVMRETFHLENFRQLSRSRRFVRPSFPDSDNYKFIGFDRQFLPRWAKNDSWLVNRLIVSPLEFDLNYKSSYVSIRNLLHYRDWVVQQQEKIVGPLTDDAKIELGVEIQRFIELMTTSEGGFLTMEHENGLRSSLSLVETSRLLGVQKEWVPSKPMPVRKR